MSTEYAFAGSYEAIVRKADEQLMRVGWTSEVANVDLYAGDSSRAKIVREVLYREPHGLQRVVEILQDCGRPETTISSDLIDIGEYREGWVAVSLGYEPPAHDAKDAANAWLRKRLLGRP